MAGRQEQGGAGGADLGASREGGCWKLREHGMS